jgi:hypothetical protein
MPHPSASPFVRPIRCLFVPAERQLPVDFVVLGSQLRNDHRILVEHLLQLEPDALPGDRTGVEVRAQRISRDCFRLLVSAETCASRADRILAMRSFVATAVDGIGQIADGGAQVGKNRHVRSKRSVPAPADRG